MNSDKAFSAPGKALIAGGYLVLDPRYKAFVVALSSRMHAVVRNKTPKKNEKGLQITINSSQFNEDQWTYAISKSNNYIPKERNNLFNPFIEKALITVLNYYQPDLENIKDIEIDIYSDPGYHSQEHTQIKSNKYKAFLFHSKSITNVPKTGLGSSAGLVTVLVAALVSRFEPHLDVTCQRNMVILHNLSQIAHCQAQGKIGSGFDVAAAIYGSIVYRRFDPFLINNLPECTSKDYPDQLKKLVSKIDWQIVNERVSLPPNLRLIMGDVNNGSETTKLVSKVKNWYSSNLPKSFEIYEKMNEANMRFISALVQLSKLYSEDSLRYGQLIDAIENGHGTEDHPEIQILVSAVDTIRSNFRLITKESGADIEPEVQRILLDESMKLRGVLTGLVPGAGGYDAISLITTDSCDIEKETEGIDTFKNVVWLDLKQEDCGLSEENPNHYKDLH